MAEQRDNMELWRQVCETPPDQTKEANNGKYKFTHVDPQYQLQRATEMWGSYGASWGLRDCSFDHFKVGDKESLILKGSFYYPGGCFEIFADMPYRWNDDAYKKLTTAARSKALSLLGFNADIYLGQYDDAAYVTDMRVKYSDESELRETILIKIRTANDAKQLESVRNRMDELRGAGNIPKAIYDECLQMIEQQEREING